MKVLFTQQIYSLSQSVFTNLTFRNYQILRLRPINFVIRGSHDAREYPNTDAMGVPLLSTGFLYSEPECGRGYDVKMLLEDGQQFLLEYLSPGWVEFTFFLLSLPIPGDRVRRFDSDWPDERCTEFLRKQPLQTFYCNAGHKNYHFHPCSFFIASSLLTY